MPRRSTIPSYRLNKQTSNAINTLPDGQVGRRDVLLGRRIPRWRRNVCDTRPALGSVRGPLWLRRLCWFQPAVAAAPANVVAHNNLGTALHHKGKVDEAI